MNDTVALFVLPSISPTPKAPENHWFGYNDISLWFPAYVQKFQPPAAPGPNPMIPSEKIGDFIDFVFTFFGMNLIRIFTHQTGVSEASTIFNIDSQVLHVLKCHRIPFEKTYFWIEIQPGIPTAIVLNEVI